MPYKLGQRSMFVCVLVHATKKDLSAEQTWRIRNIKYTACGTELMLQLQLYIECIYREAYPKWNR